MRYLPATGIHSRLLNPMTEAPSKHALEESLALAPTFDADGLVTCVATDVWTGDVLMVAHMNEQALRRWRPLSITKRN